jgi:signal transduction histidine kinase
MQDITAQKRREQALKAAKDEAEKAEQEAEEARRMQSVFLANMSHEIRTPLTTIIGFAEALGTEAAGLELPEDCAFPKYAKLIEKGGTRLLETLDGVLNLSQLEAEQMQLASEPVGLGKEACRAAEELRPEAEEKQIDLEVQCECSQNGDASAEDVRAVADEGGVQIVLRNLLSNAIKYTGEGGTVWVRSYREESRAVLEVEDTGIGMEPSMVDRLFEPFRQESEGLGREYEGSGVGLAVTKRAVEKMDGSVGAETEKGEGSRFTVRLPLAE